MAERKSEKELATELTIELIKGKHASIMKGPDQVAETWLKLWIAKNI